MLLKFRTKIAIKINGNYFLGKEINKELQVQLNALCSIYKSHITLSFYKFNQLLVFIM